jgi:RsiW-degrading membrane proteinase PrsW (M82 family)
MKANLVRSFLISMSIFAFAAALAAGLIKFNFTSNDGSRELTFLLIFLVVTYVPLIYFYVRKKRSSRTVE